MFNLKNKLFLAILFIVLTILNISAFSQGSLVIVGGGLEHNNKDIFEQMIELAGGKEKASFAIIPSASGVSVQSFVSFKNALISYGVKPENIHLIEIAMVDDDSTLNVDESEWKHNGNNNSLAEKVRTCSAVWFTGGDQLRTIKTLVNSDGSKTKVLDAVWQVYHSGGVIGGTSAGAAIMSKAMIGGGNSLGSLENGVISNYSGDDFPEGEGLLMAKGLGFFPAGIVDQHFSQRARIGRLIVALFFEKENYHLGFGVDENTAIVYLSKQNKLKIAGKGGVTIINIADASMTLVNDLPEIKNILISYLENGDVYNLTTSEITPSIDKKPTRGNEYYSVKNPGQAGIFSAHSTQFKDLITIDLIDNRSADTIKNISFFEEKAAYLITLYKTNGTLGYYTDKPDGADHYTVVNFKMNITPVEVHLKPYNKNEGN